MTTKRLLLFLLFASVMVHTAVSAPITRSQARLVAMQLVGISDDTPDDGLSIAPYYVFSRGAGQGYVIVSGDDTTAPIIGYTEQGDFSYEQEAEPLRRMLDAWAERIAEVQLHPVAAGRSLAPRARAIATYKKNWTDVKPLLKTHWHQSSPYNDMAPQREDGGRCATGCVATAGSQVAYYFRKDNPSELQYATPTYGYGVPVTVSLPKGTPLEWNLMKLNGKGTSAQDKAVATLVYALGASAGLTYGESTSGHNYREGHWNMADALKGQLRLNFKYKGKWQTTQQAWEELIYNNLKTRRPMLYSGVHPESGGHSVVLDGYQASTGLYHFNFGWGGQSDGWFTVDDATGMNGFNDSQDLVYDFTPQVQNLSAQLQSLRLYHKAPSNILVTVTNQGTLDYSGIFVYTNAQPKLPSQPAGTDMKTVLVPDEPTVIEFNVTTAQKGTAYIFVCDKNKRILDSCQVEVVPTAADLHLTRLTVDAGSEATEAVGHRFQLINNTTARVSARLTNGPAGTYCMPAFQCYLDQYDESKQEWKRTANLIINDLVFQEGQTQEALFAFEKLTPGLLYRAYLNKPAVASTQSKIAFETPDSIVYFAVRQPDLAVTTNGRMATVSGRWNAHLFSERAADDRVCVYDITALTELSTQPIAANPNALFVATAAQASALADGHNMVTDGVCDSLVLQTGSDFCPLQPFTARKATFVIGQAEAGKWVNAVVPFAAEVPYGMQVKLAIGGSSSAITHDAVRTVPAMSAIVCLTGHDTLYTLQAEQVAISTDTVALLFDNQLACPTVQTPVSATDLLFGEYLGSVYYLPAGDNAVARAFEPYVVSTKGTRMRVTSEAVADAAYKELSASINAAYEALAAVPTAGGNMTIQYSELLDKLRQAEDMLTYRSTVAHDEILTARRQLDKALDVWRQSLVAGIGQLHVNSDTSSAASPQYYSVSGQRLSRGMAHGLVIVRQGRSVRKVFLK